MLPSHVEMRVQLCKCATYECRPVCVPVFYVSTHMCLWSVCVCAHARTFLVSVPHVQNDLRPTRSRRRQTLLSLNGLLHFGEPWAPLGQETWTWHAVPCTLWVTSWGCELAPACVESPVLWRARLLVLHTPYLQRWLAPRFAPEGHRGWVRIGSPSRDSVAVPLERFALASLAALGRRTPRGLSERFQCIKCKYKPSPDGQWVPAINARNGVS